MPEDWNGRIWKRLGCDFSDKTKSTLPSSCARGGYNGGLECAKAGGSGVAQASLAEWNLNAGQDWYDVSRVDGFNTPMTITNNVGCKEPFCPTDISKDCPAALSVSNSNGDVVGCLTSCGANLDGNQADSGNCCSGLRDTPETCPKNKIE